MAKIIQFTHPGAEHKPDVKGGDHKSWNTCGHKRKFMHTQGEYVSGSELKEGELAFWGEWEPPSDVVKLASMPTKFHPQWLHKPYLPKPIPLKGKYQNTDPCVFGENFKYVVCKQFKPKNMTLTPLARLEKGSLILFGSTANQNKKNAFFQLDTVFVVSDFIEYDISDPKELLNSGDYWDLAVQMLCAKSSLTLRLYKGATFKNPVNGMYSFSPAKIWKDENMEGFPRLALKDLPYLTNNLNAAPKITEAAESEIADFWNLIRKMSIKAGYVEGVKFDYENRRVSAEAMDRVPRGRVSKTVRGCGIRKPQNGGCPRKKC